MSKYKSEYDVEAYKLCLLGATDRQLADFFDVSEQTINNWKKQSSSFLESLKRGKSVADAMVANSLFSRANGYSHMEDKIFNANGVPLVVPTIKHYPPDTTACIFWLKNRQPFNWRDKQEIVTSQDWEIGLAEVLRIIREEVKDPESIQRIAVRFNASFEVQKENSIGAIEGN